MENVQTVKGLMSVAELTELAKSVQNRGKTLNRDVQKLAMNAIAYANIHGDITIANTAHDAIKGNKGIRVNSFVKYCETYGKLQYSKESKGFVYRKRDDVLTDPMELFLALGESPWYEAVKQETPESIYDMAEMVKKFIAKCEKLAANPAVTLEHAELLERIRLVCDPEIEVNVVEETAEK